MIRALVAVLSVSAGVWCGTTAVTSCASDCGCPPTLPLRSGEFTVDAAVLSPGAAADLRDVTLTDVSIGENAVTFLYHRQGKPGAVTYRPNFKSMGGYSEVIDSDAGL